ncbi:type II toxin-antitoxin system prevent-host-death family antitoxin [Rhizobium sp. TRM95111]|uniref:type II toxin-antitoxin system Phd/YefM family antitoxin n=1 Tax=Rhizobium alarense TaxID=2846851 RepID=UPI001F2555AF|nr:type II toxin-antitoxin system prevent-host-death family antitoxin [Rhizobium alarense]MCF3642366.1 type II toxin-antitoxin system prevent-host-death family antitoxin [Rhizobium alarense]
MSTVNMLDAKTQLSKLVSAVESGEEKEIIIARNGKPAAKLVPLTTKGNSVRLGLADGKYPSMSLEEFDSMNEEIAKMFEGSE